MAFLNSYSLKENTMKKKQKITLYVETSNKTFLKVVPNTRLSIMLTKNWNTILKDYQDRIDGKQFIGVMDLPVYELANFEACINLYQPCDYFFMCIDLPDRKICRFIPKK